MLAATASPSPTLSARSSPKSYQRHASPRIRSSTRTGGSSSASANSNHNGPSASAKAAAAVVAAAAASAGFVSVTSAPSPGLGMVSSAGGVSRSKSAAAAAAAATSRSPPPSVSTVIAVPPPLSPTRRPRSASWDIDPANNPGLAEVATSKLKGSPDAGKRLKVEHSPATSIDVRADKGEKAEEALKSGEGNTDGSTQDGDKEKSKSTHNEEGASEAQVEYRLPDAYEDCQPPKLGACIAEMLMALMRINDKLAPKDGHLTRFHSRAPPDISVHNYLSRLVVHATLTPPILLCMVYYIDRLCSLYPAFTINSLTVHRYLITAATVACKGLSDSFWTNNTYARVGGISPRELASLEMELLARVEWRIVPKPEVLTEYYRSLVGNSELFWLESGKPKQLESEPKPQRDSNLELKLEPKPEPRQQGRSGIGEKEVAAEAEAEAEGEDRPSARMEED